MANKSIISCVPNFTYGYDEYVGPVFSGLKPKVNRRLENSELQKKQLEIYVPHYTSVQLEKRTSIREWNWVHNF